MIASFTRNSTAHLQNGTLVNTNLPRFEAGRFAQAVMVEEWTTNLLTANQSSVEDGTTTGFFFLGTAVLSSVTTDKWQGNNCIQAVLPGLHPFTEGLVVGGVSGSAGTIFTGSLYFKAPQGISFQILLRRELALDFASIVLVSTGVWQRVNLQHTLGATTTNLNLTIRTVNAQAITFWVDGLQIEQRAYATSWQLGGTRRAAEVLTIPTAGVLSPTEGTIEFNSFVTVRNALNGGCLFSFGVAVSANRLDFWHDSLNTVGWFDGVAWTTSAPRTIVGVWRQYAFTWGLFGTRLYIDGVLAAFSNRVVRTEQVGANLMIGNYTGNHFAANSLIDDLRISNRARTDQEIADAFASGQPLPIDDSTTALYNYNGLITSQVFRHTGNTPAIVVPKGVVNPGLAYTGHTTVETIPKALFGNPIRIKSPTHAIIKDSRTRVVIE